MRVITNPPGEARAHRIGNNVSRHIDQILILAQRMIMETALPHREVPRSKLTLALTRRTTSPKRAPSFNCTRQCT